MENSHTNKSKPSSLSFKVVMILFGLLLNVVFPWGAFKWLSQEYLPFLGIGSRKVVGLIHDKYKSVSLSGSGPTKTSHHLKYSFRVPHETMDASKEIYRMSIVDKKLYDMVEKGENIVVRYVALEPNWSHPADSPPSIWSWFLVGILALVVLAAMIVGSLLIYGCFTKAFDEPISED